MQMGTKNWDVKNLQRRKTVEFFFQGNMLVHRGSLNHFLSNGIELSFSNNGAISFDLSGQVSEKNGFKKKSMIEGNVEKVDKVKKKFGLLIDKANEK